MKIDRVHVQHYKSLTHVDITLHPQVTVLVGPNGSGKSNFVGCIELMRDLGKGDDLGALKEQGGFDQIFEQGAYPSSFCEVHLIKSDAHELLKYELEAHSSILSSITCESAKLDQFTKKWVFTKTNPLQMRLPRVAQKNPVLTEDLLNWAEIYKAHPEIFARALEALQRVLPDLSHIEITPAGNSYLFPVFHFIGKTGEVKKFDVAQLSDGTLHLWCLLLSLYQQPSPDLIVIEEPELYLHPGVLGLFADCVKEVSEVTQIILTTHSPHLVNKFAPEQIRVVSMVNGSTQISNIHANQKEAVEEGLMSLGEFMSAEGLRPAQG